jgi:pilus assembly protein CpaF
MAGMDLPIRAIREQVSSAIDVICQQERMRYGTRKVTYISEVSGMEGDIITMTDIFTFEQTGVDAGKVVGRIRPTGMRPKFMDKIEAAGINLPPSIFGIGERRRY